MTSGVRGGADLIVQVVFILESHECDLMADGARERTARLASSDACEMCAVKPCLAAIVTERINNSYCDAGNFYVIMDDGGPAVSAVQCSTSKMLLR
jgi:hypothetical protein